MLHAVTAYQPQSEVSLYKVNKIKASRGLSSSCLSVWGLVTQLGCLTLDFQFTVVVKQAAMGRAFSIRSRVCQ